MFCLVVAVAKQNSQIMKRVLVTENREAEQQLISNAFEAIGDNYTLTFVSTGEDCLEYLHNSDNYDLCFVLLDLHVPGVTESNILPRLSLEEAFRTIPVIVFSAGIQPDQIVNCYNDGANAFVRRPENTDNYNHVIASITDFWGNVNVLAKPEAVVEF